MAQCPSCHSIKIFPGVHEGDGKCSKCYGSGYGIALDQFVSKLVGEKSNCLRCNGSGECPRCDGTGVIEGESESESGSSRDSYSSGDTSPSSSEDSNTTESDGGSSGGYGGGSYYPSTSASPSTKEGGGGWLFVGIVSIIALFSLLYYSHTRGYWSFAQIAGVTPRESAPREARRHEVGETTGQRRPIQEDQRPVDSSFSTSIGEAKGPRYTGSGRVYKVPELKTLLGKKINNSWVYGDFILQRTEGNTGYFITMAWVGLPKEGSTQVEIDYPSGIVLSDMTVKTIRRGVAVVPVHIRADAPVQLLSVTRMNNGKLLVKARAYGPLKR